MPWFAVGLGLPIAMVAVVLWFTNSPAPETAVESQPDLIADEGSASGATDEPLAGAIDQPAIIEPEIVEDPEPHYPHVRLTVESGDTLDKLFRANALSVGDLTAIVKLPAAREPLRLLRPGDVIDVWHEDGRVRELTKEIDYATELSVRSAENGVFDADIVPQLVEVREAISHGVIESSLFESAAQAGLDDNMIMNLAGIFAWDIDFVLDIRRDDEYFILYEEIWKDGRRVADGEIIAAEFVNNGRIVQAIRHVDSDGRSDYFAPDGRSVRKAFIRAPVDFTRISSNFNPNRRHPVLNTIRAHRGVDYAAPKGTPVKAAGDGKIIFRGRNGGYGNAVVIQHGGNITTLYAHLSSFARNARLGSRVRQGQVVGFVGATGLATAAHLHYEYRVNGVHRNPRTVKLPAAEPIDDRYKADFLRSAEEVLERLDQFKQTRLASLN